MCNKTNKKEKKKKERAEKRIFPPISFVFSSILFELEPLKHRPTYEPPCFTQVLATPSYKRICPFLDSFEVQFLESHYKAINERET